jgi:hypothetical protein
MGKSLSPVEKRIYRLCDEALYWLWDPIGVSGAPQARDEYYGYLPKVFQLVMSDKRQELVDYLRYVSEDRMGVPETDAKHREKVADYLIDGRDWIRDQSIEPEDA